VVDGHQFLVVNLQDVAALEGLLDDAFGEELLAQVDVEDFQAVLGGVIQEVAENVSRTVETDNLKVDVKDKADVLDREELSEFDRLSINDRLLLLLVAMQMPDTDGAFREISLSEKKTTVGS